MIYAGIPFWSPVPGLGLRKQGIAQSEANLPELHERKGSLALVGWHEINALRAQDELLDRTIS